jgi:hypothetical protein
MNIHPAQVGLSDWETQLFRVEDNGSPVVPTKWEIVPEGRGSIVEGVYTAPRSIFVARNVVVVAIVKDTRLSAVVELSNTRAWSILLAAFLTLTFVGILAGLFFVWPKALATIQTGDQHATVAANDATKTKEGAPPQKEEQGLVHAARVVVGESSLTLTPSQPTLHEGESIRLTATTMPKSDVVWNGAICTSDGVCTAPSNLAVERTVDATATTAATTGSPALSASVSLHLLPGRISSVAVLLVVLLCGALGGLLHATKSLVAFVGNQTFVSRWALFYFTRPVLGAIMAFLVYLVLNGGLAKDPAQGMGIFSVAAVAGLVGLFSDQASMKLKEIFDVVLGPKSDARGNKLQEGPSKPTIVAVSPAKLAVGATGPIMLVVKGSGFDAKAKAQVDGKDRSMTFENESQVTIQLDPADVATARTLVVTIINSKGESSSGFAVQVT